MRKVFWAIVSAICLAFSFSFAHTNHKLTTLLTTLSTMLPNQSTRCQHNLPSSVTWPPFIKPIRQTLPMHCCHHHCNEDQQVPQTTNQVSHALVFFKIRDFGCVIQSTIWLRSSSTNPAPSLSSSQLHSVKCPVQSCF